MTQQKEGSNLQQTSMELQNVSSVISKFFKSLKMTETTVKIRGNVKSVIIQQAGF